MKGSPVRIRASALLFLAPFEDFAEGLLHFGGEGEAEGRVEGLYGEGAEAVDRLDDLGPALVGPARFVEGLPEFLDEEVDEGAGRGLGVAAQLLDRSQGRRQGYAHLQ